MAVEHRKDTVATSLKFLDDLNIIQAGKIQYTVCKIANLI